MSSNVPGQNNLPPVAADDTPSSGNAPQVNANDGATDITAMLLANDSDPNAGDTFAVSGVSNLGGLSGQVTFDSANLRVLYDPNGQFIALPHGARRCIRGCD
ncbi:MAG: hypothetical protein O6700_00385 [Gammaproteobacteria bacterium]|nr:hypothetical protein [Gammaproteobacteria bacterium]